MTAELSGPELMHEARQQQNNSFKSYARHCGHTTDLMVSFLLTLLTDRLREPNIPTR
jgi:hypothetical protein